MADVAERCGANVTKVSADWGRIIEPAQVAEALDKVSNPKLVAIVHAETSTGALTPVEEISKLAHDAGALFVLDAVTSLGGCPVRIDDWEVDAVYSGTQKCLSCPPGLAPVSLSNRAMDAVKARTDGVRSWYLDVNLLANYWGDGARVYHHTAPISMNYALHESLRLTLEEGLQNRWTRHESNHNRLKAGLDDMGLNLTAQEGHRLWQLNAVGVPNDADEAGIRTALLNEHGIEIGPGLGPLQGKVWRVGLMGHSSSKENVDRFLGTLKTLL
jgi:alanine-glyoxylate transaminase/serine-glyoxylate transaminase/serine-pyruvate transaminase